MNILFLMCDSLIPHLTGPYGDPHGSTPTLDRLASEGVLFESAYCNSPLCAPSRASMLTGRYTSELCAFDNASAFAPEWPTAAHSLRSAGYEAVIIGKMHFLGHDQLHGFDRRIASRSDYSVGYNPKYYSMAWQWSWPSQGNPVGKNTMGPSYVRAPMWEPYPGPYEADNEIHKAALEWLGARNAHSGPFFCCVSYHAPHNPFWVPEEYRRPFRDKPLPLPSIPPGVNPVHGPMDRWLNTFHYVPEIADRLMTRDNLRWLYENYYGMVLKLDNRVAELLDVLRKTGLAEDTAIVFTSDHGDMLAHRCMVQKRYFYERSVRVPLIFSFPGRWKERVRLSAHVSLLDIMPTLCDIAGAPKPQGLPGVSLLPSLETGREPESRTVFAEYHSEGVHAPCFMAVKDGFKYLLVPGHEERLYNVSADPDEYHNIVALPEHSARLAAFRTDLSRAFDPDAVARKAITSQINRRFVYECALKSPPCP